MINNSTPSRFAKSTSWSVSTAVDKHRVVRTAGGDPGLGRGRQVRLRLPDRAGHRQLGQRLVRRYDVHLVEHQAEPVAQVADAEHCGRSRSGVEDQSHRVLSIADAERVDLDPRPVCGDGRADLEHVRTQDLRGIRAEMVGVVLHERGAAGRAGADRLDRVQHDRGLPVALAAEAVALGHQPLHRHARQLAQPAEVLEVRGERAEATLGQERPQTGFDLGAVAQRLVPITAGPELGHDLVRVGVRAPAARPPRPRSRRPPARPGR